ncbi:protein TANC2-like isoform X2 [Clavelina lepadiformis]|uniref:protein TANC2-like isoform X2 n=1 Tax=Clavelina lepadiformis TaxID=159417 RepID=UPI00404294C4
MTTIDENTHALPGTRKPKFVEIPSVPSSEEDAGTGSASSTTNRPNSKGLPDLDDPDPSLMTKLGLFLGDQRVSHVKTTNHPHPMLSHHNSIKIQKSDLKKKQTISPASTLSDKGIGSSVGSFDSEFRHGASVFLPSTAPYDPNRTGSLDSRTHQDLNSLNDVPLPTHSRSSSDIICPSAVGANFSQSKLAEQSNAPLWNSDPRRGSKSATMSGAIRTRRPSTKRPKPQNDPPVEKDAEVKKLPQLCRDSPNRSTRSSVSSSQSITPAVSVSSADTLPLPPLTTSDSVKFPADNPALPSIEVAPPLPPKNFHLYPETRYTPSPLDRHTHLQPPHIHNGTFKDGRLKPDDSFSTASSTLTSRIRLASDGAAGTLSSGALPPKDNNPSFRGQSKVWSDDVRREVPVTLNQGKQLPLSSSFAGLGISRAESTGVLLTGGEKPTKPKLHGSINALWEQPRPHSVLMTSDDRTVVNEDDTFKRQSNARSSTRSNPGDRRRANTDAKVRFAPYRPPDVVLQGLQFELPSAVTSETKFVGRDWLFNEILSILASREPKNKGVIITGSPGYGKTAIVDHLVSHSYHGWRNSRPNNKSEMDSIHRVQNSMSRSSSPLSRQHFHHGGSSNHSSRTASPVLGSMASSRASSQTSLTEDSSRKLASQIVAFHFCQSDNNTTCYVPEFLHSIAAQLSQAPQLTAYRELLIQEPHLQNLLSIRNCIQNPSQALHKAILEPLVMLKQTQKLPRSNLVIVVDALNEAELYRPDCGFSILSFLQQHLPDIPDFIKLVATCRTDNQPLVAQFPVHFISLDSESNHISRDMQVYVNHRMSLSSTLANLSLSGKSDPTVTQKQLSQHLLKLACGSFLFLRMTLDLIEQGAIVPKSAGFKVIPVNMHEVFLLQCNLRFMSYTSFDEVRDVVAVALASLYPLKDDQLYQAVCSGLPPNHLPWPKFKQQLELLDAFLVQSAPSGGRVFFHPCFREWLLGQSISLQRGGTLQSSSKFRVDVKRGYALLATVLSHQPVERLHQHATLELAHHVLKAGMFKNQSKQTGVSASESNARFMASSSKQLTEALSSMRNLFYPNLKVSKLLLRAGANPNIQTSIFSNASPLSVVAHTGCTELAEVLLMFGADVNLPASNGMAALTFAAAAGHLPVVELLLRYSPALNQMDQNGHTPLLHAISRGHSAIAKLLLSPQFFPSPDHQTHAAQQALVAASTTGNTELINYLLDFDNFNCDVNGLEPCQGESPLTSAAAHGKSQVCEFLVRQFKASFNVRNKNGFTPLISAVKHGEWDAADLLLNLGAPIEATDASGKTPLITAACHGHLGVVELLLSRGANVHSEDREGLTALGWASLQGHPHCVRSLIGRSKINHCDMSGRTALHLAAFFGDAQVLDLLLDQGADITHMDASGMCALDRAIGCQNIAVVARLLQRGVPIQATSWAMAIGKPNVTIALLTKSLEDGNSYYKNSDFVKAREVYARSLKHVGELSSQNKQPPPHGKLADTCAHLLLGYSRCLRKLGDLDGAESSASRALDLKPHWYEALYARARVLRELLRLKSALRDVMDAEQTAPTNNLKEIRRLIEKIKEEIRKSGSRHSRPPSVSSEIIPVPHPRPRLNSASSYHGNTSRGTSPTPSMTPELARSFQGRNHGNRISSLYGPDQQRVNSHDGLSDSMISLPAYSNDSGLANGSVRRVPRTNPHWRPSAADFHRSMSEDNRHHPQSFRDDLSYGHPNGHLPPRHDPSRASFVTDL